MNRKRFPMHEAEVTPDMMFKSPDLGAVVTRTEAALLWMRAFTSIDMQIAKGRLECRTALTGGTVLITTASLRALWGDPVSPALEWAFGYGNTTPSTDEDEVQGELPL